MKSDTRGTLAVFGIVFGVAFLIGAVVLFSGHSDAPPIPDAPPSAPRGFRENTEARRNDEKRWTAIIDNSDLKVGDYVYLKPEGTFHRITAINTDAATETETLYAVSGWPVSIWDRIQLRAMRKEEWGKYLIVE